MEGFELYSKAENELWSSLNAPTHTKKCKVPLEKRPVCFIRDQTAEGSVVKPCWFRIEGSAQGLESVFTYSPMTTAASAAEL